MTNRWWTITFVLLLALVALALAGCGAKPTPVAPVTPKPAAEGPSGPGAAASASGTIEGVVLDATTGEPLEKVAVQTSPGTPGAMTDAQGKFAIADVPVGMYNLQASLGGYDVGFQGNLSIVAGGTQDVQLSLQASEGYPVADIRGVWPTDGEVYPDEKVWITLGAGYGVHDNNKITTTGLSNVGVGTYVYLEGREVDGEGNAISGWTWSVTGPTGEAVTVENGDTRTPRFLADKEGKYEVVCEADIEGGEKGKTVLTVNAGHYVGAEACQSCHNGSVQPDTYSTWLNTGHGTKFETTFASYTAERDYCIGCHVTGYNEATANDGGFDDLAKKAGWDPAAGSVTAWLIDAGQTMQQVKDSAMGELTSVQCEACHGPGSVHTASKAYDPAVCEQCHTQGEQWEASGHALTGYKNSHTAGNAGCASCHSGEGYVVATIRGETPVYPANATPLQPANMSAPGEDPQIGCATCHDPHAATNVDENGTSTQLRQEGEVAIPAGVTIEAGEAATCVSCHADRRDASYMASYAAGKQSRGPHECTQTDVLFGVSEAVFTFGKSIGGSSPHADMAENLCITCHMAANPVLDPGPDGEAGTRDDVLAQNIGGHSFSMAGEANGQELQNTGSCMTEGCHAEGSITTFDREARGDYDGDGTVEGVQDEVKGLLALLEEKLPKDDQGAVMSAGITADNTSEAERQALWNYHLITADGSNGVHNTEFAVQVLQATYEGLTGEPVPNAKIR